MITIKEELIASAKFRRAIKLGGHETVTLWLAMKAYAASHPTDGFVPSDTIEEEAERLGIRKLEKTMKALLECGGLKPDGSRGDGLVESHEFGCVLHDYGDHAMSSDELVARQLKDRERKQLQRDRFRLRNDLMLSGLSSAEAERRVRDMTHQEVTEALSRSRDMSRDTNCDSHTAPSDEVPDSSRDITPAGARVGADTHTAARAFPSPTQPNPAQPAEVAAAPFRPRNFEQAMLRPIRDRAEFAVREEHLAQHTEPHRWPEVVAFAEEAQHAQGLRPGPLGTFATDSGVRAIVKLFATFTPTQLAEAVTAIPGDPYFKSRRGLSSFTPEVVRRLLDSRPNDTGKTKRQPDYVGQKTFRAADLEEKTA